MKTEIYRHVARPARVLYTSKTLCLIELFLGIFAGFLFGTPIAPILLWIFVTHPICVIIAVREPHIEAILRALPNQNPTVNHWQSGDRTYVS